MTTPQTVAGAIRARLISLFPELPVYRNEAPANTEPPVVVITDGIGVQSQDLGDDLLLVEQVQVDLYLDYSAVTNWADQIHAALHRAPLSIPGSQIHRCRVEERINQPTEAGNDDGVERVTFTVVVSRRLSASEAGNLPIQPTPTLLEEHEAKTTNVHGIANTAELETQTGAQAKANNALLAANAYTDAAVDGISAPDLSLYETIVGAQAKADAAEADANAYTDSSIAAIPAPDLSLYETIVGAQAKADAAEADAILAANAYTDNEVVELTNGTTDFESAQFNTAAAVTAGVGELTWNDTDGTLDLGLKGGNVTLQIGQENVQMTHNGSGVALVDGQAVYVQGAQGNRLSVNLALADSDANSSKTFGIVTEPIAANQNGYVTYSGLVRNLNTSAYPEGAALWLSPTTPGGITSVKPSAPDHLVLIGWCVRSHAQNGTIFVHVQNGYELDELHNVSIAGATDGQVLAYEASSGLWKPVTPSAGGATGGVYSGAWSASVAYPQYSMVTHGSTMYAAETASTIGAAPSVFYSNFSSNLTSADWTRFNVSSLASPAITLINNTGNTNAQAYNSTTNTLNLSNRSTSSVKVTQNVDLSITGVADGVFVGFFPSTFTPTSTSLWWAQTTAMSVFLDIFNNRISLSTNGATILSTSTILLDTSTSSLFDSYRLEWTFTSTNTNVIVYRNNIQLASFTFTQNAGQVSVRDGLAAATGGSAGLFKAQNYSRSTAPLVNPGWQKLFTLP